jgi:acetyl esterase
MARQLDAVVLSVDYAKSPRYPYPHALLQLYQVLKWCLSPNAINELGVSIDPGRVAIMGNSAGGNLTAALSLLTTFVEGPCARFRKDLPKDFRQVAQVLLYPSIACDQLYRSRFATADSETQSQSLPVWVAEMMEASYLPPMINKEQIFIAPLLATSQLLEEVRYNIAPVSCYVAGLDCLKDEAIRYCQGLQAAGVEVELKEYAGAVHGFSHYPENSKPFRKGDVEDCWNSISRVLEQAFHSDKDSSLAS